MVTALLAALSAVTTMFVARSSARAVIYQGEETDQWAFYQSKSIKAHTYELHLRQLEILAGDRASSRYRKTTAELRATIAKLEAEKTEIRAKAEGMQYRKRDAQQRLRNFGTSVAFLQLAIMLISFSVTMKRAFLWRLGMVSVGLWALFVLNGAYLFHAYRDIF